MAAAEAAESLCGRPVQIKWVNDLLLDGKKVCGILTEASMDLEGGELEYAVLGVGFDVCAPAGGWLLNDSAERACAPSRPAW